DMLSKQEREHLLQLGEMNTSKPLPDECIHQLFERQVVKMPDAVAVVCGGDSLSYGELNQKANQLAHYLRKKGVQPNTLVGICIERSVSMIVGLLGILKAGGAYVPLDPGYPQERLAFMVADSGIRLLVTHSSLSQVVPNECEAVLVDDEQLFSEMAVDDLAPALDNKSLAYVIYTSGSTGKPKGVLTPHQGVVRFVFEPEFMTINANSRVSQTATVNFDASVLEIWGALLNGAALVLYPHRYIDLSQLNQYVDEYRIDVLWLTCGLFEQWLATKPKHPHVKWLLTGGDVLAPEVFKEALAQFAQARILNCYGPSENSSYTTTYEIVADSVIPGKPVPIGKAVSQTSCYVFDSEGRLCPVGIPGELYVGGAGLSYGYLNRPELTEERFVANPYRQGEKLYRTGDLVRLLSDSNLEFIDRVDNQVKVRGFRIELTEIEHQLYRLERIQDAVVLARSDDGRREKQLVAYIVGDWSEVTNPGAFCQAQLRGSLPGYMIPQIYVVLDQLPLGPNGKVDRKALPAPDFSEWQGQYVAPQSELEKALCAIWAHVMNIEESKISVTADFFELGGHSLLSVALITKIRQSLSLPLHIKHIFQHKTIKALALAITDGNLDMAVDTLELVGEYVKGAFVYAVPAAASMAKDFLFVAKELNAKGYNLKVFNHQGVLDSSPYFRSIEDNALVWSKHLLEQHGEGPIVLVGHSYGGALALAIAKLLCDQGLEVKLCLLDVYFGQSSGKYEMNIVAEDSTSDAVLQQHLMPFAHRVKVVFEQQATLFDEYQPETENRFKPLCLIAEQTPVDTERYLMYLSSIFDNGVDAYWVRGDHFSMLKGEGAAAIAGFIVK
ncbi:amino acid adenylation domain-containing protein, partial [Rheinheimera soli]